MKLVKSNRPHACISCSLAMLLDVDLSHVEVELFTGMDFPFPEPWSHLPKVPDMNVLCHWALQTHKVALTPFERDPVCSPHPDCPSVPVWPYRKGLAGTPEVMWREALDKGSGLLQGVRPSKDLWHMCAWDGGIVYDPRGYAYSINVAEDKFDFQPLCFWLATKAYK